MRIRLMAQGATFIKNGCAIGLCGACGNWGREKEASKQFFFEKKNRKTFFPGSAGMIGLFHPSATPTITETVQW
jgi:hypothetical protein